MTDTPDIGFQFGVEGDTALLSTIQRLREELKSLESQQDSLKSSSVDLSRAWQGLAYVAATLKLAQFADDALESAVNIGNMAEKTGLSTEALSVFHKVAGDVGVSTDLVDKGLIAAAKSITQFEQGSKAAAEGFALLGLKQKDFIGLNSDQKIRKVVEALGKMPEGFNKSTAAQEIFMKGGAVLIPVLNRLADEGFDAATASTQRLGLLLGGELVENARLAKQTLEDLKATSEGLATQFEAGLLPAITDVSVALGQSMNSGDDGIKTLGQDLGWLIKLFAEGLITIGTYWGTLFASIRLSMEGVWDRAKIDGIATFKAIGEAATGNLLAAGRTLADAARDTNESLKEEFAGQVALWKQLGQDVGAADRSLFPSEEEEKTFAASEKVTQDALLDLQKQAAGIRDRMLKGVITQQQAEKEIKDLQAQQIPLIQAKAQAELEYAEAQGHASQIARARATMKQAAALTPEKEPPPLVPSKPPKEPRERAEAIDRGQSSARKQAMEDELALDKILAEGREQTDKDSYDRGLISLNEYFDRRANAIREGGAKEVDVLLAQRSALEAQRSGQEQQLAGAQAKPVTPQYPAATKERETLDLKKQIEETDTQTAHVDAQIAQEAAKVDNELAKSEEDRYKAAEEHLRKQLELEKQLAEMEGNRAKAAQLANQIEDQQIRQDKTAQGASKPEIDAYIAQYGAARSARSSAEEAKTGFQDELSGMEEKRADIQARAEGPAGISKSQEERELKALYETEIPLLQKKVDLLRQAAQAAKQENPATGQLEETPLSSDLGKQADDLQKTVEKTAGGLGKSDTGWMDWKNEAVSDIDAISTHLTTGFNGWLSGHQRFGQAVAQTWNSIVMTALGSIEKIGAQWIAEHLRMLLFKQTTDRASVASTATTTAQGDAIKRTSAVKNVLIKAKEAAVNAFTAVWHDIPFPLNAVLAPVAAAGAFAGALALGAFAQGGAVNAASATPRVVGFSAGGHIAARSFFASSGLRQAGGGPIRGPGTGTSDSVPIMASHGEHVMTARASRAIGPGTLDAMNANPENFSAMLHGNVFAEGGPVMRGAFLPEIRQPAPYSAEGFHRYAVGGEIDNSSHTGGDTHFSHTTEINGDIHALDGASVREVLEQHADLISKIAVGAVKRHFRTNGVGG